MRKSEQFREYADECERLAKDANERHRRMLLEMAKSWRRLADEHDRKD